MILLYCMNRSVCRQVGADRCPCASLVSALQYIRPEVVTLVIVECRIDHVYIVLVSQHVTHPGIFRHAGIGFIHPPAGAAVFRDCNYSVITSGIEQILLQARFGKGDYCSPE